MPSVLDFYRKFKQDFSVNSYIDILRNRGTRKSFVKFYLSNHKLCIESGRHRRPVLPREEIKGYAQSAKIMKLKMKHVCYLVALFIIHYVNSFL